MVSNHPQSRATGPFKTGSKLSPEANLVYRAAAPDMRRDADLPSLLREKVMYMVFSDQLQRSAARPAAEQAAACLQLQRR